MQQPDDTYLQHLKKRLEESERAYQAELERLAAETAKLTQKMKDEAAEPEPAVLVTPAPVNDTNI